MPDDHVRCSQRKRGFHEHHEEINSVVLGEFISSWWRRWSQHEQQDDPDVAAWITRDSGTPDLFPALMKYLWACCSPLTVASEHHQFNTVDDQHIKSIIRVWFTDYSPWFMPVDVPAHLSAGDVQPTASCRPHGHHYWLIRPVVVCVKHARHLPPLSPTAGNRHLFIVTASISCGSKAARLKTFGPTVPVLGAQTSSPFCARR